MNSHRAAFREGMAQAKREAQERGPIRLPHVRIGDYLLAWVLTKLFPKGF